MIDIPLGKALVAVEVSRANECNGCVYAHDKFVCESCRDLECSAVARKDGKNVIFKLVDWAGEPEPCFDSYLEFMQGERLTKKLSLHDARKIFKYFKKKLEV